MYTNITNLNQKAGISILLVSDTHGTFDLLDQVLKHRAEVDGIIHLGDDYADMNELARSDRLTLRVPGTRCPEYDNRYVDNRVYTILLGWRMLFSHTPNTTPADRLGDLDPQRYVTEGQCDIFCHGHTHKPIINTVDDCLVINPGHLYQYDRRGYNPSYGMLSVTTKCFQGTIYDAVSHKMITNTVRARS